MFKYSQQYFLYWLYLESWFNTINISDSSTEQNNPIIKVARHAGFCYGVRRAVDTTKKLKLKNPDTKISVLGELIHNSHVICELENLGINTLKELPHQGDGICIIRSHGESEDIFNQVQKSGFEIVDLTCFDVKKVQSKAIDLAKNNYLVIILGKPEHPEVMAICANAKKYAVNPDNIYVCKNLESLILLEDKIKNTQ